MYSGISEIYWDLLWKSEILKSVVGFGLLQPGWFRVNKQLRTSLSVSAVLALCAVTHCTHLTFLKQCQQFSPWPQLSPLCRSFSPLELFCDAKATTESCVSISQWPKQKQSQHRRCTRPPKRVLGNISRSWDLWLVVWFGLVGFFVWFSFSVGVFFPPFNVSWEREDRALFAKGISVMVMKGRTPEPPLELCDLTPALTLGVLWFPMMLSQKPFSEVRYRQWVLWNTPRHSHLVSKPVKLLRLSWSPRNRNITVWGNTGAIQ